MEKIGKDEGERSGLEIGKDEGEKNDLGRNEENRERWRGEERLGKTGKIRREEGKRVKNSDNWIGVL